MAPRPLSHVPRILMWPCTDTCLNMGNVALIQMASRRLHDLWPTAAVAVPTEDPEGLRRFCDNVRPLPPAYWLAGHYFLGRLHRLLPAELSRKLVNRKLQLRRRHPALERNAIRLRMRLQGAGPRDFDTHASEEAKADVVLASGAGGLGDLFPVFTAEVLGALQKAIGLGTPTAMFSQGFCRFGKGGLRDWAKDVLPYVDVIALRERRVGLPLLADLGVDPSRVVVTGDDAVELAYEARCATLGSGVGVSLRISGAAAVDESVIKRTASVLHAAADRLGAALLPVPIARQQDMDSRVIGRVLEGRGAIDDAGQSLDTPHKVVEQVARCRIVVAGAYHAAVFAVAQGIPAICLAKSTYYRDKCLGLQDMFGDGCDVLDLSRADWEETLAVAIDHRYRTAEETRVALLAAAQAQVVASKLAYSRLEQVVRGRESIAHGAA